MKLKNLIIICLIFSSAISSAENWHLTGLGDHSINCITVDAAHRVLAGTNKGLFIKDNLGKWLKITQIDSFPVTDIAVTSQTRIVATLSLGGSWSDGLYSADAIYGPPYYQLDVIDYMVTPQSLEYDGIFSNTPVIYVGNPNGIKKSLYNFTTDKFGMFSDIETPSNAFGVEQPICAGLHWYSGDGRLYAGGYDGMSMNPGNGNLLWMQSSDSMTTLIPKLNVSAITEDATTDCVTVQMYIGTVDSGIYYSAAYMSHPPIKLTPSPNNEKVNDLITIPLPFADRRSLCAAVGGGVYYHNRQLNTWKELGDIPAEPKCLYVQIDSINNMNYKLYAGTTEGLYLFDTSSAPIKSIAQKHKHNPMILNKIKSGVLSIGLDVEKPEKVSVSVFNPAGKTVVYVESNCRRGKQTLDINLNTNNRKCLSNSVYLVKVRIGNKSLFGKFVYNK